MVGSNLSSATLLLPGILLLGCGWSSRGDTDTPRDNTAGADSGEGVSGKGGASAHSDASGQGGVSDRGDASGEAGDGNPSGQGGSPVCDYGAGGSVDSEVRTPWDWTGVVGTGQSLAVGEKGYPVRSTVQPYNNLQLSTDTLSWPIDPDDEGLAMVPLTEPIGRLAPSYPSAWPENIAGETIHSSMGNQVTALVVDAGAPDYVSVHGQFGENGQCMAYLRKDATPSGINGRAFEATVVATQAITRLAKAEGKTYGVSAITVVHGECDAGNTAYEDDLVQLWRDYNSDLQAVTGQAESIQMLVSQQNSTNDHAASTLAQWQVGVDYPDDIACVGPTYQYEAFTDGTHLVGEGYRQLGEKFGQVSGCPDRP